MIKKITYINKSLDRILLSIKTFDIYFLNTLKNNINIYKKKNQIIQQNLLYDHEYIATIYKIYTDLCLNEFQYILLIILKNYCNNPELNMGAKYKTRFKYLLHKYLIQNIHIENQKKHKITNIKITIIYIYVLTQIENSYGFYALIQYLLII
uniref:hypothetical protein n=1 Tax=Hypnea nidifica TaxID=673448 RepID=UPI0027DA66AF|nr:hypothetical protein REP52_pgp009 [Hypnea nidifica]WCH54428.1 hypothetical protein [Hypnea nidifica]